MFQQYGSQIKQSTWKMLFFFSMFIKKGTGQEFWLPPAISILLHGRPPAHKLVIPWPLDLDMATGGLTSNGAFCRRAVCAPVTKCYCSSFIFGLTINAVKGGVGAKEITDLFRSQRKHCGMCYPHRIKEF